MQGILNDKKREAKEGRNVSFQNSVDAEDDDEVLSNVEGETVHKQGGVLRSLILTPTRELAMQIKDHIQVDPFLNTGQKFLVLIFIILFLAFVDLIYYPLFWP